MKRKHVEIFASVKGKSEFEKNKSNLYRNKISCRWKLTKLSFKILAQNNHSLPSP